MAGPPLPSPQHRPPQPSNQHIASPPPPPPQPQPSMAPSLPAGWEKVKDPATGKDYYYNKVLGVTQWDAPIQEPPPPPPPALYPPQPPPPTSQQPLESRPEIAVASDQNGSAGKKEDAKVALAKLRESIKQNTLAMSAVPEHAVAVDVQPQPPSPTKLPGQTGWDDLDELINDTTAALTGAKVYGSQKDEFWVWTSTIMLCITYTLVLALAIVVIWQMTVIHFEKHVMAWIIGAVFVMICVPLSLQDIHFHIIHYVHPLQRHYIRILWMIPVYAVESWIALRFNESKIYLETMREAYESYVVYSFFKLMRDFLGDKPRALAKLKAIQEREGRATAKMLWPYCCFRAWRLDAQFLTRCSLGVYQYVVIRTLCAFIACVLEQYHLFAEGSYATDKFYLYYVILVNFSQCHALWCLVVFYHEFKEDLMPIGPLPKFLIIKAIVFVSWWQGIIIMYMAHNHMIAPILDYSSEDVAKGLQNLLICAEMLVYGIGFHFVFSYKDFLAGGRLRTWLDEEKAEYKAPEEALKEMMPIDVYEEGKGYVERVPKFIDRHTPDAIKEPIKHATEAVVSGAGAMIEAPLSIVGLANKKKKSDWKEIFDETHKRPYWWNEKTNETTWEEPAELKKIKDEKKIGRAPSLEANASLLVSPSAGSVPQQLQMQSGPAPALLEVVPTTSQPTPPASRVAVAAGDLQEMAVDLQAQAHTATWPDYAATEADKAEAEAAAKKKAEEAAARRKAEEEVYYASMETEYGWKPDYAAVETEAAGAFAGLLHVTVHKIDGFSDTAGFPADRTDPYVLLQIGSEKQKTSAKKDAGGKNVIFDETLTFTNKQLTDSTLKIQVYDQDTLKSDDLLGEYDLNLNLQNLREEDDESKAPVAFECMHQGKPVGKVYLRFLRKAVTNKKAEEEALAQMKEEVLTKEEEEEEAKKKAEEAALSKEEEEALLAKKKAEEDAAAAAAKKEAEEEAAAVAAVAAQNKAEEEALAKKKGEEALAKKKAEEEAAAAATKKEAEEEAAAAAAVAAQNKAEEEALAKKKGEEALAKKKAEEEAAAAAAKKEAEEEAAAAAAVVAQNKAEEEAASAAQKEKTEGEEAAKKKAAEDEATKTSKAAQKTEEASAVTTNKEGGGVESDRAPEPDKQAEDTAAAGAPQQEEEEEEEQEASGSSSTTASPAGNITQRSKKKKTKKK